MAAEFLKSLEHKAQKGNLLFIKLREINQKHFLLSENLAFLSKYRTQNDNGMGLRHKGFNPTTGNPAAFSWDIL